MVQQQLWRLQPGVWGKSTERCHDNRASPSTQDFHKEWKALEDRAIGRLVEKFFFDVQLVLYLVLLPVKREIFGGISTFAVLTLCTTNKNHFEFELCAEIHLFCFPFLF